MVLVIIGTGGFGREVLWAANASIPSTSLPDILFGIGSESSTAFFVDDNVELHGSTVCDVEVIGKIEDVKEWAGTRPIKFICGVGSPKLRRKFVRRVENIFGRGFFDTVVADSVNKSRFVEIGTGSVVCAGTNITTQVKIGEHVNINLDCTVGHDVTIGDFTNISPGVHISGYVNVGEGVDIGTGANILPHVNIGRNAIIGAGACVTKDVPENALAVGVPAKNKERIDGRWQDIA